MEFYKGAQEPATSQIWFYPIGDGNFECRVYGSNGWQPITTEGAPADGMSQKTVMDKLALKLDKTSVKQTTGTSTTDVMSQKAVTDELALKEATANKQNSLTADETGTKFPTVDAVNEEFGSYRTELVQLAKEVEQGSLIARIEINNLTYDASQITVDTTTNTITIQNHELVDGDRVAFVTRGNFNNVPVTGKPIGHWYVVANSQSNSFTLNDENGNAITFTTSGATSEGSYNLQKLQYYNLRFTDIYKQQLRVIIKTGVSMIGGDYKYLFFQPNDGAVDYTIIEDIGGENYPFDINIDATVFTNDHQVTYLINRYVRYSSSTTIVEKRTFHADLSGYYNPLFSEIESLIIRTYSSGQVQRYFLNGFIEIHKY